jgi:hypothetical protein
MELENIKNEKFVMSRQEMGQLMGMGLVAGDKIYVCSGKGVLVMNKTRFEYTADTVVYANQADYKSGITCDAGQHYAGANDVADRDKNSPCNEPAAKLSISPVGGGLISMSLMSF